MKKINLLTILFAALLVSGNVWAQLTYNDPALESDVATIGTKGFATIADAFAFPEDGVSTTIVLTKDVDYNYTTPYYCTLNTNKVITLDLNGFHIVGTANSSVSNQGLFDIRGTFTLIDSKFDATIATTGEELKANYSNIKGYLGFSQTTGVGSDGSVIRNYHGNINVKSGALLLLTDATTADRGAGASYCIDNNSNEGATYATIDGGYYVGPRECFRTFPNSTSNANVFVINNAICYGMNGIFFAQDPSSIQSGKCDITIAGGNFYSDNNPMIRVYTTGGKNLENMSINISGGTCNTDALMISHTYQQSYAGTIEELIDDLQEHYKDLFNITGGTFASENYQVKVYQIKDSYGTPTDKEAKIFPSTLPTLLTQGYYDKDNDGQSITITPVHNNTITSAQGWADMPSKDGEKATLGTSVAVTTGEKEVAALELTNNSTLTIKDGATMIVGDGGILVDDGSKIVVEAGGILRVGAKGLDNADVDELVVYSNLSKSGVISLSPKALVRQDTKLTLELASNARSVSSIGWWQYIGIPTSDYPNWSNLDGKTTWAYEWDATNQQWNQITSKQQINTPFKGYILTSNATASGTRYQFTGNMNNKEDHTFDLKAGWNLLANSYMAPIDLASFFAAMEKTDGVETTVSIYDSYTASYKYVSQGALLIDDAEFTSMAPMQGFFIQTSQAGSFKFDYAACVWGQEGVDPLRAPGRNVSTDVNVLKINVKGSEFSDQISLYEGDNLTADFDNGWDITKFMNEKINLYASLNNNNLATIATSDINGTQLSFMACNDVEYTMTFSNRNNENFVLVDTKNNAKVAMTDGATYTFVAAPNTTDVNRFQVVRSMPTDLQEVDAIPATQGVYTMMGQYVADVKMFNALPAGVYVVNGVKVVK